MIRLGSPQSLVALALAAQISLTAAGEDFYINGQPTYACRTPPERAIFQLLAEVTGVPAAADTE